MTGVYGFVQEDSLGSATSSTAVRVQGRFNAQVGGDLDGTIELQRSFDGSTYQTVSKNSSGDAAAYTAPCSLVVEEIETGVWYRWTITTYTSGTAACRISQR